MARKILYISGTRADYGLMQHTLREISSCPGMELELVVTGMHLMHEFGRTVDEIYADGFKVHEINETYESDDKVSMARFAGRFMKKLVKKVIRIKPDVILILGDRAEALAGAVIGSYLSIPVAHVHGGDVSSTVDEHVRHAITKLSHVHFAATRKSANRIIKMGEEPSRIFVVGEPGADAILNEKLMEPSELSEKYSLDLTKPIILVVQHPVTMEVSDVDEQMRKTLEAVAELAQQTVVVYPNADAGSRKMIDAIKKFEKYPFIKSFKTLPRNDYLSIMKHANVIIGNSSSGIIESKFFGLPSVNIGTRQAGREKKDNVIDASYDKEQIKLAVMKCLTDKKFLKRMEKLKSSIKPGNAGKIIASVLSEIDINGSFIQKRMVY
ncbi:MAG: UDP-N-acetylglucosamine 2-epimerase [Candidatus Aenigmatarchaeota archaeon]